MATILPHSSPRPLPPSPLPSSSPSLLLRRPFYLSVHKFLPLNSPSHKEVAIHASSSIREAAPVVAEDSSSSSNNPVSIELESLNTIIQSPDFRGCKTCGRQEIEKGCNGEGRIQGGIATVPGFGWWPIKAFKPCPEFLASGGRYRRRGQSMDEVAFGRMKRGDSVKLNAKSSKKTGGPKKLKG